LPAVVAAGKVAVSEVAGAVSVAPVVWTNLGAFVLTGLTVSETGVECVADAPVPVTLNVTVPGAVAAVVEIVNVDDCPAVTVAGLNDADAPLGNPDALNATLCAAPLVTAVETVEDPP
jgi:hypothetical protein